MYIIEREQYTVVKTSFGVSKPYRNGSIGPAIGVPAYVLRRFWTTPLVVNDGTGREMFNNRRPCVSSCGRTRVDLSVADRCPVVVLFQRKTENGNLFIPISTFNCICCFAATDVALINYSYFCIMTLKLFGTIRLGNAVRIYIRLHISCLCCRWILLVISFNKRVTF